MVLELIGCGFNAHGQLQSLMAELEAGEEANDRFPTDISPPRTVAVGHSLLKPLFVGWSDLLLERDGGIFCYGAQRRSSSALRWESGNSSSSSGGQGRPATVSVAGSHRGPLCAIVADSGEVFVWEAPQQQDEAKPRFVHAPQLGTGISHISIAGNDRACVVKDHCRVFAYRHYKDFLSPSSPSPSPSPPLQPQRQDNHERAWSIPTRAIAQLVANDATFALLTAEGEVFTWGDPRHQRGLGREPSPDEPADEPAVVSALQGLRIAKLSAGGLLVAALSADRDLYIWGTSNNLGQPPGDGEPASMQFLPGAVDDVGLVDLGEGIDVVDVAVGADHICVLTTSGDVYAAGYNGLGQVGGAAAHADEPYQNRWLKWDKPWRGEANAVFSGPSSWNTFVVVERPSGPGLGGG